MYKIPLGNVVDLDDSQFYDRVKYISFLYNYLEYTNHGSTPVSLITGVKGIGKTTLLHKLKKMAGNDYLFVYIDLSLVNKYWDGKFICLIFMKIVYDSIINACTDSTFIDLNFPVPSFDMDYSNFADFVMNLPRNIYEEYKQVIGGVWLFFDEFQMVKELDTDVNSFLWYIRSLVQSQEYIAYVFSGSMSIKDSLISDIAGKQGAFGGRILSFELAPFSFETIKAYLNEKVDCLNFTEDGLEQFYHRTGGIPFYINTFARLLAPILF